MNIIPDPKKEGQSQEVSSKKLDFAARATKGELKEEELSDTPPEIEFIHAPVSSPSPRVVKPDPPIRKIRQNRDSDNVYLD